MAIRISTSVFCLPTCKKSLSGHSLLSLLSIIPTTRPWTVRRAHQLLDHQIMIHVNDQQKLREKEVGYDWRIFGGVMSRRDAVSRVSYSALILLPAYEAYSYYLPNALTFSPSRHSNRHYESSIVIRGPQIRAAHPVMVLEFRGRGACQGISVKRPLSFPFY